MAKEVWAVFNRNDERMFQYPATEYCDLAMNILRNAQHRAPFAGMRLKKITINDQ